MDIAAMTIYERINAQAAEMKVQHAARTDALAAAHFAAHPECAVSAHPAMRMNRRWWKVATLWQWREGDVLARPTESMAFNALVVATKVRDDGLRSVILNIWNIERYRKQKAQSIERFAKVKARYQPYAQRPRRIVQVAW